MPPSKPRRAHTLPPTTPLAQQVGGHAGVHVTEDESLLLKPALPREVTFYQFVRDVDNGISDPSSGGVHALRDWIPAFIGLLNLEGKLADHQPTANDAPPAIVSVSEAEEARSTSTATPSADDPDTTGDGTTIPSQSSLDVSSQTIVLQNLLHGYRKPCVLDVKLGTVLYDEDASEEKKARMIRKAAETTSLETGVRLTGFQVYSNHSPDPVVYGREYGYNLKPNQLSEGVRNFFPCSTAVANPSPSSSNADTGLPVHTLLILLSSVRASLIELHSALSGAHVRIVGGSVLIIYEGDWETAVAACGHGGGPSALNSDYDDDDAEGEESDHIELEVDEQGQIVFESLAELGQQGSSETLSSSPSSLSDTNPQPRLYTVSLIDFAHARFVFGEGPDEGVLKGMDTLIRLVDQRRQEVEAATEATSFGEAETLTERLN